MAVSNKFGAMLVTTGNKSEMSVGYATIYGDMNGGFNPIERPLQDGGVPALRPAQSLAAEGRAWPRRRGHPGQYSRSSRPRPSCARTRRIRIRCRPMRCSTPSSRGWSKRRCASPTSSPQGYRSRNGQEGRAAALSRRIQAPAVGARRQGHEQEFRPRPALSDPEQVPRSGRGGGRPGEGRAERARLRAERRSDLD